MNPLWTAVLTAVAALGGVAITTWADAFKERRRIAHDLAVRQAERTTAATDRRRTFEIENLQAAYDGLWLLGREMTKTHLADREAAKTEAGYGGTLLPAGVEGDIALTSQAAKAIRLILDDRVRALAQRAQSSINEVSMLGVKAKIFGRGPVGEAEGDAAVAEASGHLDEAMTAIADRLRAAVQG